MTAIALLIVAGVVMVVGRCALFAVAGLPVRPWSHVSGLPKSMRQLPRVLTNLTIAGVVLAYPLIRGEGPVAYYADLLPGDVRLLAAVHGFAVSVVLLSLIYIAWLATDNVRFRVRHRPSKLARKLAVVPFSAVMGALAEELLFRGVLLADLLESFDVTSAVAIGTVVFVVAHYIRPVKRYWTIPGHLVMSLLICLAFVWTRNLWLSVGLHAGGIFMTLGTRPVVRYTGPAWLVGASIFPYAGVVGIAGLVALAAILGVSYGIRL